MIPGGVLAEHLWEGNVRRQSFPILFLCLVLMATLLVSISGGVLKARLARPQIGPRIQQRVEAAIAKSPLRFEANQGQTDPEVQFVSRGPGYALFLTPTSAVIRTEKRADGLRLLRAGALKPQKCWMASCLPLPGRGNAAHGAGRPAPRESGSVLRLKLVGANPSTRMRGLARLPASSNYFIGNDPVRWRTRVPSYAQVRYEQVYPGIDLLFYGNPSQLEFDFQLAPGANPDAIRLDAESADQIELDGHGDLILTVGGQQIRMQTPAVYQQAGGRRREIAGRYILRGARQVGFEVAAYDARRPLTIDPVLSYSTYLGGSGDTNSPALSDTYNIYDAGIAVDSSGNAYLTGYTTSLDFPSVNPAQSSFPGNSEVFVSKFDPTGSTLLYSTVVGGGGDQDGFGIAVDSSGNAYVTGFTTASNFPTTPGAYRVAPYSGSGDVFVFKLNAGGSIGYSTYLGGNGFNVAFGIAVDSGGNAYVAGYTDSTNFPTANAYQGSLRNSTTQSNAFVTKFNPAGSALVYSTYLGGNYLDYATGIALDSSGNAYVTGSTESTTFPVSNGAFNPHCGSDSNCNVNTGGPYPNSFITKLNTTGSGLAYSTYLGGSYESDAAAIAVDSTGNAYVVGSTTSPDFPATSGSLQTTFHSNRFVAEGFVTKMNPAGTRVVYSTYLGGSGSDSEVGIAVDSSGNAYVAGTTTSLDFPLAGQPFQPTYGGHGDATVAELDPNGATLIYSSYIGGSQAEYALGIAVDAAGSAYVTGVTFSADFPTANPFQGNLSGTSDAFLAKIRGAAAGGPSIPNGSVVNGASFAPSAPLSPGSIASVFGSGLASSNPNGTVLTMNGIAAPLYFVGAGQINFQVPWELAGQSQATLTVTVDGAPSNPVTVNLANFGPGIFTLPGADGKTTYGTVLISSSGAVAAPVGSIAGVTSQPVNRGDYITIFCTGLGPVSNQPPTGVPASDNPLSFTSTIPVVIVGIPAAPTFYGLTPGFFGLYQVNAQIPQDAPPGPVSLQVQIGGQSSNIVTIAVQ